MDRIGMMINWMMSSWKPACALIYTIICLFDFVVFPMLVSLHQPGLVDFVSVVKELEPTYKTILYEYTYRQHVPFTLSGGGLFHLSFGAILTGAVFGSRAVPAIDSDKK